MWEKVEMSDVTRVRTNECFVKIEPKDKTESKTDNFYAKFSAYIFSLNLHFRGPTGGPLNVNFEY